MKASLDLLMAPPPPHTHTPLPPKIQFAVTVLHPDYSHSLVAFVAIDEPESEGARIAEAGSAVAGAGSEPSLGQG